MVGDGKRKKSSGRDEEEAEAEAARELELKPACLVPGASGGWWRWSLAVSGFYWLL
jgi:hypothetical protein